jgi:magnesium transporter
MFMQETKTLENLEEAYLKWPNLSDSEKVRVFYSLDRDEEDELFLRLSAAEQKNILEEANPIKIRTWLRSLEPDDLVDLLQEFNEEERAKLLVYLDERSKNEVNALLAYRDDVAGGLMNTRFARLRPNMSAEEALKYLRAQGEIETIYYAYVMEPDQKLIGVVSLRQLFAASPKKMIHEIMTTGTSLVTLQEGLEEEKIAQIFSQWSFLALPVVNAAGIMKGILTVDDVVNVVQDVATEDIQKLGGQEALDAPYFQIGFFSMLQKRAGWLLLLFIGEMFTATAMSHFEVEIEKAVVLALFIPLIISSGGNSGSQASTLIIRAMALGEVRLSDWWRVFLRELSSGLSLGLFLGVIGLMRITLWPTRVSTFGEHYFLIGLAVSCSLVGIVMWGTLAGSMLPFVLRKCRLDPATASAPFVATLVDVTGLVLYFTIASFFLKGTLL